MGIAVRIAEGPKRLPRDWAGQPRHAIHPADCRSCRRRSPLRSSRGCIDRDLLAGTVGEKAGEKAGSATVRRCTVGCRGATTHGRGCGGTCSSKARVCSSISEARSTRLLSFPLVASSDIAIGFSAPDTTHKLVTINSRPNITCTSRLFVLTLQYSSSPTQRHVAAVPNALPDSRTPTHRIQTTKCPGGRCRV